MGLFVENGPYSVTQNLDLNIRATGWNNLYNMLYIDQPVGTGFSFTGNDAGYANNNEELASDLYEFMIQFYTMFPYLVANELYFVGESYAGKYYTRFT